MFFDIVDPHFVNSMNSLNATNVFDEIPTLFFQVTQQEPRLLVCFTASSIKAIALKGQVKTGNAWDRLANSLWIGVDGGSQHAT